MNVIYDSATKTIICTFLSRQDNSEKFCNISLYADCNYNQKIPSKIVEGISDPDEASIVRIQLNEITQCYIVEASNSTFTIFVLADSESIIIILYVNTRLYHTTNIINVHVHMQMNPADLDLT